LRGRFSGRGNPQGKTATLRERLYALCRNTVLAFDTRSDSLVAGVDVPASINSLIALDLLDRRLCVTVRLTNIVYVLRDTTSDVSEARGPQLSGGTGPTVVHGILRLPQPASGTLLDASGRAVLALKPGPNDVSRLAPGVYFILTPHPAPLPQGAREPSSTISKLVLAR